MNKQTLYINIEQNYKLSTPLGSQTSEVCHQQCLSETVPRKPARPCKLLYVSKALQRQAQAHQPMYVGCTSVC